MEQDHVERRALEDGARPSGTRGTASKSGTSKGKAKGTLDTAKKLEDQPEVTDALRNGELSEDQASLIADAADVNPSAAGDLVKRAKNGSINDLRQECSRAKAAADGDEDATHARVHRNRSWKKASSSCMYTLEYRCV